MMIRDCKHLIKLPHIHMEQTHLKYAKAKMIAINNIHK